MTGVAKNDDYLDEELPDSDDTDSDTDSEDTAKGGNPLTKFLDGIPPQKIAAIAAAGLIVGFFGGRVTAPDVPVRAVPMTTQVAPTTASDTTPTKASLNNPDSWEPGTSTVPPATPTTEAIPPTYTDRPLVGYSTKMPREWIRDACLNQGQEHLAPDQCLRRWEMLSSVVKGAYWRPLIKDPEQTIIPPEWR